MNKLTQSAVVAVVSALAPLAAQAEMVGLSDTELSAIQGQASVAGLREGFHSTRMQFR